MFKELFEKKEEPKAQTRDERLIELIKNDDVEGMALENIRFSLRDVALETKSAVEAKALNVEDVCEFVSKAFGEEFKEMMEMSYEEFKATNAAHIIRMLKSTI